LVSSRKTRQPVSHQMNTSKCSLLNSVLLQKTVEMQQIADTKLLEAHITSCHEQADQFSETLMSLELQLVDQLEVRIKRPNAISITERMEVSQISFFFLRTSSRTLRGTSQTWLEDSLNMSKGYILYPTKQNKMLLF